VGVNVAGEAVRLRIDALLARWRVARMDGPERRGLRRRQRLRRAGTIGGPLGVARRGARRRR
jgi:hypothetical protein